MNMQIFDSLTKEKKTLNLRKKDIKLYVCGPTVYDCCHIGHARVFIFFDALRRFLLLHNPKVIFVQNITDVADKITNKALELKTTELSLVKKFTEAFVEDCGLLNVLTPTFQPLASKYIQKIIEYIQKMLDIGVAYITASGVYLDVNQLPYWQFEQRQDHINNEEELTDQKSKNHFALWKFSEKHHYKSPWGDGIPGWHIECTVMSSEILGEHFDIHGGGSDLKFPHHENEIAQSNALCGHGPADIWVHSGMINIKGDKMSKSLNNFWYIRDMITNSFEADAFRYLFLSHNYSSIIEISTEKIQQAKTTMKNIRKYYFANCKEQTLSPSLEDISEFLQPLYDDFDSPALMATIGQLMDKNNSRRMSKLLFVLGFKMENLCKLTQEEICGYINQRNQAKLEKNFSLSDEIRNLLEENFVILEDSSAGTVWKYY